MPRSKATEQPKPRSAADGGLSCELATTRWWPVPQRPAQNRLTKGLTGRCVGQSRSQGTAAAHSPGLFTAGLGLAGDALRFTLNTTQRRDGRVYRQTDLGLVAGLAAGNRQHLRRRHEPPLACRKHRAAGQLARTLLARALAVNRDEAALDRSAQVGATYRTSSVAFDGEYTADKVPGGGTLRSLTLKVTIDVAPGWRVVPGFGQSRSDVGARVNYAMVSATYGW